MNHRYSKYWKGDLTVIRILNSVNIQNKRHGVKAAFWAPRNKSVSVGSFFLLLKFVWQNACTSRENFRVNSANKM